jgi:hypothetical protein
VLDLDLGDLRVEQVVDRLVVDLEIAHSEEELSIAVVANRFEAFEDRERDHPWLLGGAVHCESLSTRRLMPWEG